MNHDELIRQAILQKKLIQCYYEDHFRVIEPHVYGIKDTKYSILAYQVGGKSSSGKMGWKRMFIEKMVSLHILEENFEGPRSTSGDHSSFDTTLLVVK